MKYPASSSISFMWSRVGGRRPWTPKCRVDGVKSSHPLNSGCWDINTRVWIRIMWREQLRSSHSSSSYRLRLCELAIHNKYTKVQGLPRSAGRAHAQFFLRPCAIGNSLAVRTHDNARDSKYRNSVLNTRYKRSIEDTGGSVGQDFRFSAYAIALSWL